MMRWLSALTALMLAGCSVITDVDDLFIAIDGGGGDSDSDSDGDVDCPPNSGWPCSCDFSPGAICEDDSQCVGFVDLESYGGVCAPQCSGQGGDCPEHDYEGQAECWATDGEGTWWCILMCDDSAECPPDQECVDDGQDNTLCL